MLSTSGEDVSSPHAEIGCRRARFPTPHGGRLRGQKAFGSPPFFGEGTVRFSLTCQGYSIYSPLVTRRMCV